MRFITTDSKSYSDLKDTSWGNYRDNKTIVYIAGKGRYLTVNVEDGAVVSKAIVADSSYHYGIKTTAISEDVKKKNLYDLAGNLWEWTMESYYSVSATPIDITYSIRGGSFHWYSSDHPVCYRGYGYASRSNTLYGFRPVLYMK